MLILLKFPFCLASSLAMNPLRKLNIFLGSLYGIACAPLNVNEDKAANRLLLSPRYLSTNGITISSGRFSKSESFLRLLAATSFGSTPKPIMVLTKSGDKPRLGMNPPARIPV